MAVILVDYRCRDCRVLAEYWTPSPPPQEMSCHLCGAVAKRVFAGLKLVGSTRETAGEAPRVARQGGSGCAAHPALPGMCTLTESAARMLSARARNDTKAIESELARQEKAAAVRPPTLSDVVAVSPAH